MGREWTIQQVARATGTTSRTLRHYGEVGLLPAARTGANGYRYYDEASLRRLQRILLLRELGLGLAAIGDVLAARVREEDALAAHLVLLEEEAARIARQVRSVRRTLAAAATQEEVTVEEMFDGFDASRYEQEVVERWGRAAHEDGQRAWRELGEAGRCAHLAEHEAVGTGLAAAAARGDAVEDAAVQELVRRHHAWVSAFWTPDAAAYRALTRGYVEDERFRATYEAFGPGTAGYLCRAADVFAQRALT